MSLTSPALRRLPVSCPLTPSRCFPRSSLMMIDAPLHVTAGFHGLTGSGPTQSLSDVLVQQGHAQHQRLPPRNPDGSMWGSFCEVRQKPPACRCRGQGLVSQIQTLNGKNRREVGRQQNIVPGSCRNAATIAQTVRILLFFTYAQHLCCRWYLFLLISRSVAVRMDSSWLFRL